MLTNKTKGSVKMNILIKNISTFILIISFHANTFASEALQRATDCCNLSITIQNNAATNYTDPNITLVDQNTLTNYWVPDAVYKTLNENNNRNPYSFSQKNKRFNLYTQNAIAKLNDTGYSIFNTRNIIYSLFKRETPTLRNAYSLPTDNKEDSYLFAVVEVKTDSTKKTAYFLVVPTVFISQEKTYCNHSKLAFPDENLENNSLFFVWSSLFIPSAVKTDNFLAYILRDMLLVLILRPHAALKTLLKF